MSDREGPAPTRRAVLAGSGAALVAGVVGTARSASRIEVATTGPYREVIERADPDGIDLRPRAVGDAARGLAEGAVDAAITGRPVVADRPAASAVTAGWAALDGEGWREVLGRSAVRNRWRGAARVGAWSESTWERVAGLDRVASADRPALVRGTRSHQYAAGAGGVGYYEAGPTRIATTIDAATARRRGYVPVERVGYVHARDPAQGAVEAVLGGVLGDAPAFADPAVAADR